MSRRRSGDGQPRSLPTEFTGGSTLDRVGAPSSVRSSDEHEKGQAQ